MVWSQSVTNTGGCFKNRLMRLTSSAIRKSISQTLLTRWLLKLKQRLKSLTSNDQEAKFHRFDRGRLMVTISAYTGL